MMKKLSILVFSLGLSLTSLAQEQPKYEYCEMVTLGPSIFSHYFTIEVDYGNEKELRVDKRLKDPETGELRRFYSRIEAVNFLARQGWELVEVFTMVHNETLHNYHYIFKKQMEENEAKEIEEQ